MTDFDKFVHQLISYSIIGMLFIVHRLMDVTSYFFDFLEDAEVGAENYLMEELGWEITKFDED